MTTLTQTATPALLQQLIAQHAAIPEANLTRLDWLTLQYHAAGYAAEADERACRATDQNERLRHAATCDAYELLDAICDERADALLA